MLRQPGTFDRNSRRQYLRYACADCGAKPWQVCTTTAGQPAQTPHKDRVRRGLQVQRAKEAA